MRAWLGPTVWMLPIVTKSKITGIFVTKPASLHSSAHLPLATESSAGDEGGKVGEGGEVGEKAGGVGGV